MSRKAYKPSEIHENKASHLYILNRLQPKKSIKRKLRILDLINYGCKFRKKY